MAHTLLHNLPRDRISLSLALLRARGEFLPDVPGDVTVHSLGEVRLWGALRPLLRLLREMRPEVVFSTANGTNVIAVLAKLAGRGRYRLVLSERNALGRVDGAWKNPVLLVLKRLTYHRADLVTAVSEGVAGEIVATLKVPRERVRTVFNPVVTDDLGRLAAEDVAHPWFDGGAPVILGCGRLVPQKDFPTLLAAFADVRGRVPARLVVLGEGPEENRLRDLADDLGVAGDVWFAGFDINPFRYMARSACFVLSSRHEGLPNALIQAMACGTAAVSTDCPHGPSEIISPGVDGLLCPVGDARAMAACIERVLTDGELRARIAAAARNKAARYSARASLERYVAAVLGGEAGSVNDRPLRTGDG